MVKKEGVCLNLGTRAERLGAVGEEEEWKQCAMANLGLESPIRDLRMKARCYGWPRVKIP